MNELLNYISREARLAILLTVITAIIGPLVLWLFHRTSPIIIIINIYKENKGKILSILFVAIIGPLIVSSIQDRKSTDESRRIETSPIIVGRDLVGDFVGRDKIINYIGDTTTTAAQRGQDALIEVKSEIMRNFMNLSILIGAIEVNPPTAFWDIRRANETELAYQDRARHYFQEYQHGISLFLQEINFSETVYNSFQRDLISIDANLRRNIKNTYNQLSEVADSFNRLATGMAIILSFNLNDKERTARSIFLHQEKVANAKITIYSAVAYFCLVLKEENDTLILSEHLASANINLKLKPGAEGYKEALFMAAKFSQEKALILTGRTSDINRAKKREIERRIKDPYLIMLRKSVGLTETLSEPEVIALQKKEINMDENDPAELIKLAAYSFLESDGHASIIYLERALKNEKLSPVQKKFISSSIDRLKNPDKYENSMGIMIAKVHKGGSLEKAGLKMGDVIISLDGNKIHEPMEIASAVAKEGGKPILLKAIRDKEHLKIIINGGEPIGATLTQLVVLNAIQL